MKEALALLAAVEPAKEAEFAKIIKPFVKVSKKFDEK